MTSDDWADQIFTSKDAEELNSKYEKILYNSENGIIMTLGISNEQCMEFCYHYFKSRRSRKLDVESIAYIESFLCFLAEYLEEHLEEEGLDFMQDFED